MERESMGKILIVDDRKSIIDSISLILEQEYLVCAAFCGKQAVEMIRSDSSIRGVFLDLKMDDMDGLETLKRIKQINQGIKVCILTAEDTEENRAKSKALGVDGFIGKPCNVKEIVSMAKHMCNRTLKRKTNSNILIKNRK